jgi:hypothetical protein
MRNYRIFGSSEVSKLFVICKKIEPSYDETLKIARKGIFLGNSEVYSMPCFFNTELPINSHVFIAGMSGSGKTYLMKNLIIKAGVFLRSKIILIDLTGEYKAFADFLDAKVIRNSGNIFDEDSGVVYVALDKLDEKRKIATASKVLQHIITKMRKRGTHADSNGIFLFLDESWKILSKEDSLNTVIREGRKYKVGLVLASQLIEDISPEMLGNMASVFIFRTQNRESLRVLAKNYGLGDDIIAKVQNFEVGRCLFIQNHKEGRRDAFIIRKISGFEIRDVVILEFGDCLNVRIDRVELSKMIKVICKVDASDVIPDPSEGHVKLSELIVKLIINGSDRNDILFLLRKLGIKDVDIADGFGTAIGVMKDEIYSTIKE